MKEDRFIRENTTLWKDLEYSVKKLKSGKYRKLGREELDTVLPSYNRASSHLSYSRTFYGNTAVTEYLNRLVSSAHSVIYTKKSTNLKKLLSFYALEFPSLIKKKWLFIVLSTFMFLAGFFTAFCFSAFNPDNASAFVPENIINGMDLNKSDNLSWNAPAFSSMILTNNIRVGFFAFALGMTGGLGTLWVLVTNGALLGGISALTSIRGQSADFWALILPHGILELFAIFVCGAAGLIIGWALISPGKYSRKDSLIINGRDGMKLVAGTIPLFIVAGLIEGFVTPAPIENIYKYGVALATLVLLGFYLVLFNMRKKLSPKD